MRIGRVLCALVVLVVAPDCKPALPSTPTAKSSWPSGKTVIPWLEVNVPRKPLAEWSHRPRATASGADSRPAGTVLDYCLDGLVIWADVTDQAIVSTKPGKVLSVYPQLMARKPPNLSIIGGLKTYILQGAAPGDARPYDFADPDGWRRIAREARQIVEITGVNIVVLESETAWQPFQQGKAAIDFEKLRKSLAPLRETGIQFWWNPIRIKPNTPEFPDRQEQTTQLVRAIADALPNCVFLTSYTAWRDWKSDRRSEATLRRKMRDLLGQSRMQERLLVTVDGRVGKKRAYTPKEALNMIAELPGEIINVYPTGSNWVDVARKFQQSVIPNNP